MLLIWRPQLSDPATDLIPIKIAAVRTTLSTRQISRLVDADKFPKPVTLGVGRNARIAFVESEVTAWLRARIHERDQRAVKPTPEPDDQEAAELSSTSSETHAAAPEPAPPPAQRATPARRQKRRRRA
jgi:predicted DNA-binding transcriptional regulator AlpA